jgi:ADP-ribosyl-[dinitrogen reductase] hydrolase
MDWERSILDAIRSTADDWAGDHGRWQPVLDLYDRTAGSDREALEQALVRMIDQGYRNPYSRQPEETPWGGLAVAMPAGMQPEDLASLEAAALVCAERGVSDAFFPFQRLLGAPRWHALMPNLRWLQAEVTEAHRKLGRTRAGRTLAALTALAAGDALGATLEFGPPRPLHSWHREMTGGGPFGWEPGEWTDDTAMALAVAEGIAASPPDPVPAVGDRVMHWYASAPKDIGSTIRLALSAFNRTASWESAAAAVESALGDRAAGNGALMRTLPVALAYGDREEIVRQARVIGRMTHPHPVSEAACAVYCLAVSAVLDGRGRKEAWDRALAAATPAAADGESGRAVREALRRWREAPGHSYGELESSGYVVHTLEVAAWCFLQAESLEDALLHAVNLGGDSDTAGAVSGGLAGAYFGLDALPRRWSRTLKGRERLTAAAEALWNVYRTRKARRH